jgi:DNA end-binding protein Ku
MKSIWNGAVSFGLVSIPIKMYPAVSPRGPGMRMLHKEHHTPIKYKKWCPACDREIASDEIEKGIELSHGTYYVLSETELRALKPEKTESIEIISFVDQREIDPIHIGSHYYLGPARPNEKTYFLFKDVLASKAQVAIGRFVLREKEYVCAIESYREGLLLTTLNYEHEIRSISEIPELGEKPSLKQEEVELAGQLIEKLRKESLSMGDFKDTFTEELKELIKRREKGEVITLVRHEREPTREENLIEALKASLK